jgi:hypothetical protein
MKIPKIFNASKQKIEQEIRQDPIENPLWDSPMIAILVVLATEISLI